MAICKTCGTKYSKWAAPVSAGGLCPPCFESVLSDEPDVKPEEPVALSAIPRTEKRSVRIRLTSFIPRSRSKPVFAFTMSCYCVTLEYFIIAWARALHPPPPSFYLSGGIGYVVNLLAVAPIIESLILVAVFELVRRAHASVAVQVITAAVFMSVPHAWRWWPHAVIVLPSFCIQSASYLYWRRTSWKTAFWVVASIHALNNSISAMSAIGRAIHQIHPHM